MKNYICTTCGTQFAATDHLPEHCPICEDERQYVEWDGQAWTTLTELQDTHNPDIRPLEPGLVGIGMKPSFAIGQRALLVQTPSGNVLWDCIPFLNDEIVDFVEARGGIDAIAISHPHYYAAMVEWSRTFNDAPIYLHAADREWVMQPDKAIRYWEGDSHVLTDGVTLIRTGGHFDGSAVLHWREGAGGQGILLTGDSIKVAADRRYVSFMYSYPNHVPLSTVAVKQIARAVAPFTFDRIYGAWFDHVVRTKAKVAVRRSVERYMQAIQTPADE